MGRKKKDIDDAFFADFDAMEEDGEVKETPEDTVVAPSTISYASMF